MSEVSASASASASAASLVGDKANPTFKIVGICLAIGSGVFIGSSFVIKKKGLLNATMNSGNAAGEGHAYLKNWIWWTGMIMMVVGEVLNFVAYAFTEAILVTPMGALSVVISAILSHFFLKESLTLFGWIGCVLCIIGATILALNAPEQQSVTTIEGFKKLFLSPGFLVWASILIIISLVLMFWGAKKWGKTHMMVYITICSLIGGISVSCTQGLGASIVTSIGGNNQVKNWFFWFLFVFVVVTLLVEINYLNKALELFNTSMVVPVYFCTFTTAVMITSFILYQGLKASAVSLITMVLGFITICLGITLLQMSKVDPTKFKGLGRRTTILMQAAREPVEAQSEKEEVTHFEDPGMDALRGGFGAVGSIIRARSVSRRMSLSQAGLSGGKRWYEISPSDSNLSTHGMENLQRYQLSDTPMPEDAADKISHHRSMIHSPSVSSGHEFPPPRSKSRLKFDEEDVVHQYDPNRHHMSIHTHQTHPTPKRQHTAPPILPPTDEEDDDDDNHPSVTPSTSRPRAITSPVSPEANYFDLADDYKLYTDPYSRTNTNETPKSNHRTLPDTDEPRRKGGLASMFNLNSIHSLGPSPKGSRSDLKSMGSGHGAEYPKMDKRGENPEERDRLFGGTGRQSEDLYRPSGDISRGGSTSPEGSPVRYTQRL